MPGERVGDAGEVLGDAGEVCAGGQRGGGGVAGLGEYSGDCEQVRGGRLLDGENALEVGDGVGKAVAAGHGDHPGAARFAKLYRWNRAAVSRAAFHSCPDCRPCTSLTRCHAQE